MATGAAEWLPAVANGHAAVQLDGASLVRSGALRGFPVGDADRTMLMVTRSDAAGATGAGAIRYGENSCGADFGVGLGSVTLANGCTPAAAVQQSGGWSVLSVTLDGGVYAVHENGNLLESSNAALQTPGMRFLIDGSGVQVAEVVLYDHALGDIERQRAEAYLREKYVDGICDPPCLMPRVVSDLTDRAVCAGSDVLLSVGATGDGIEFEWYRDDQRIVGASSATLQVSPQAPGTVETYQVRVVSFCGETWSSVASVRSLLAAQLLAAPGDYHLCPGDSVDLQVQATGSELTYEWAIDGVVQPMATSSTYSIVADAASAPIRMFQVTVSNGCSAIATPPFEVCVEQTPVITQQPGSRSACAGDDVTLSAAVDAPLPVDYQWFHGGVALVGETSAELVLNAVEAADSGSYAVQVSNRCGTATSDAALFMVGMPPQFVVEPVADSAFCPGAALEMSAVVSGDGNLYQWQRDGVPIPGALDADLLISPLSAGDAGAYELVVSNVCGTVTSVAVAVSVREPLAITSQPTGGSLCAGDGVLLTAAAAGDVEVWQWRRDGVAIPGATTAQLVLGGLQVSDSGRYDVVASGPCGAVTSNGADVLVHGVPEILVGLTPLTTCEGFDVELTVLANGSGDLGYQWRLDGLNLAGATSATLVVSGATLADAGVYDVVVTSACGAATADGALLTVLAQQQCDCDANGVLDGDDLASGFATDCNNNGVIDSCDIAAGTSVDANSDGIPDDCTGRFLRGDVNGDEAHTLADSIVLLNFVFSQNNAGPLDCHDAADFNDDGELNLIDVVGNMMYTFALGAFPAAPFPSCGADPTHDALGCDRMACQ